MKFLLLIFSVGSVFAQPGWPAWPDSQSELCQAIESVENAIEDLVSDVTFSISQSQITNPVQAVFKTLDQTLKIQNCADSNQASSDVPVMSMEDVAEEPTSVKWEDSEFSRIIASIWNQLFTVLVIDASSPCPNKAPLYYLVMNAKFGDLSPGDRFASWRTPGSLAGPGEHRYLLLVYLQPNLWKISSSPFPGSPTDADRMNFGLGQFLTTYSLQNNLVAALQFKVTNPDALPNTC